ncbi:hypothetical protein VNO77_04995 [Canavalia gladiata]|uniref:Uncharacterized protein n=1 Tax=Canavalia gladiata TaxID=3824 RepID=A0AAN9R586_CANGL
MEISLELIQEVTNAMNFMFAQVMKESVQQELEGILRVNSNKSYKDPSDQIVSVKSEARTTWKTPVVAESRVGEFA